MKIVLDTNILLVSISNKSKLHWIFRGLLEGKYTICISNEILSEYFEIIQRHMGHQAADSVGAVLENLPNVEFTNTYYRFHLLPDEDDNKFVDCYIASNASFIVSHDKDFNVLKKIKFPKVEVIDTTIFKRKLEATQ